MRPARNLFNLALEEASAGKTEVEKEKVFYARMESLSVLKAAASSEHQIQWQVRIAKTESNQTSGRMRVRSTTIGTEPIEYVQTIKIKNADGHEDETSIKVTQDVFQQFSRIAENGMEKTRYFFSIPNRTEKWEVDVFRLPDGKICNWVKIDFEYGEDPTVPELPSGFLDVIPGGSRSKEDQDFISKLYAEAFLATPKAYTPEQE